MNLAPRALPPPMPNRRCDVPRAIHPALRLLLVAALPAALACSRHVAITADADAKAAIADGGSEGATASLRDAAPPSAAPDDAEPDYTLPPTTPEHTAFADAARKRCEPEDSGGSTADMTAAERAKSNCLWSETAHLAARLSPEARARLAAGAPDPYRSHAWSPAWERLSVAACALDDARAWVHGARRLAGSMRYIGAAACPAGRFIEGAYLLQTWVDGRPSEFARHVLASQVAGQARLRGLEIARASAARMRLRAPDDIEHDDESWGAVLADADWRRIVRSAEAVEESSRAMSDAVCGGFGGLEEALGGAGPCREHLRVYFAVYLPSMPKDFGSEVDPRDYEAEPPSRDADMRAGVDALIERCRRGEDLHYTNYVVEAEFVRCLERGAEEALQRAKGLWPARLRAYARDVCAAEEAISKTYLGEVASRNGRYESALFARYQCSGLAAVRGAFLGASMRDGRPDAFARHVRHRVAWADRVRLGVANVRAAAALPPCKASDNELAGRCRSTALDARAWATLARGVDRLSPAAEELARGLCGAWPELASSLPEMGCVEAMTRYFLSYPTFLGLAAPRG